MKLTKETKKELKNAASRMRGYAIGLDPNAPILMAVTVRKFEAAKTAIRKDVQTLSRTVDAVLETLTTHPGALNERDVVKIQNAGTQHREMKEALLQALTAADYSGGHDAQLKVAMDRYQKNTTLFTEKLDKLTPWMLEPRRDLSRLSDAQKLQVLAHYAQEKDAAVTVEAMRLTPQAMELLIAKYVTGEARARNA